MAKFKPITNIKEKDSFNKRIMSLLLGTGNFFEIFLIIFIWFLIFSDRNIFSGFTKEEVFAYIFLGGIISMLSGYFLYKIIRKDVRHGNSVFLTKKPFHYLAYVIRNNLGKIIVPFILYTVLNFLLLRIFVGKMAFSLNAAELTVFLIMVLFAFTTEFLLAYFININVFWTIQSENMYTVLSRFKKIMAGAYFPLDILGNEIIIFLLLPFAYSFYVPTQLLLGNVTLNLAINGLFVQIFWIGLLYTFIKKSQSRQAKNTSDGPVAKHSCE